MNFLLNVFMYEGMCLPVFFQIHVFLDFKRSVLSIGDAMESRENISCARKYVRLHKLKCQEIYLHIEIDVISISTITSYFLFSVCKIPGLNVRYPEFWYIQSNNVSIINPFFRSVNQ